MRLDRSEKIAGQPVKKVRDFLRYLDNCNMHPDGIAKRFGLPDASNFVAELMRRDLLEPCERYPGRYAQGPAAPQFAAAKFLKPLNRDRADKIVREFLDRVDAANQKSEFLWSVNKVSAFGSYINPAKAEFGDIDLAILLTPGDKDMSRDQFTRLEQQRALDSGRRFRDFSDELAFPRREVWRFIKAKVPYISLHEFDDMERLGVESMALFSHGERH
jgi:hypothetical protein